MTVPKLEDVRSVSPAFESTINDTLFADLWKRPGLSARDRSLETLAILISRSQVVELPFHVSRALDNGVKPAEISELINHLAFYAGIATATAAIEPTRAVFLARGVTSSDLPEAKPALLPIDASAEAERAAAVEKNFGAVAPGVVHFTTDVIFRDLWLRPGLAPRDRSFVTVSALIANGQAAQITYHLNRAMNAGVTQDEASEMLTQAAFYAGWPNVFSALPVFKDVFVSRAAQAKPMQVTHAGALKSAPGPADYFDGKVTVTMLATAQAPSRVSSGSVAFDTGAHSAWHTHPLGQLLIVTEGSGLVQEWGKPAQVIKNGDVIWTPPGVKHWHGACAACAMTHTAVQEELDGKAVVWLEKVDAATYAEANKAEPPRSL